MPKLEAYSKKLDYSYAPGVYPSLQLMLRRPHCAQRLLLHRGGAANSGVEKLLEICDEKNIRIEYAQRALERISQKENIYASVVFSKYSDEINGDAPHILFAQPADMGNLGTNIRTALGLGYADIATISPCADWFDPRVVRASMGSIFAVHNAVFPSIDEYLQQFNREIYMFRIDKSAITLESAARRAPDIYTLAFGNEAQGLPKDSESIGTGVMIPQSIEIDSFNLSVAAGIAMYEFAKGK